MINRIKSFARLKTDRRGVTALEYGLIAGVIVATIAVGFALLANDLSNKFAGVGYCVSQADSSADSNCNNQAQ
jgi:Flp pilus assembly pilin Flp